MPATTKPVLLPASFAAIHGAGQVETLPCPDCGGQGVIRTRHLGAVPCVSCDETGYVVTLRQRPSDAPF